MKNINHYFRKNFVVDFYPIEHFVIFSLVYLISGLYANCSLIQSVELLGLYVSTSLVGEFICSRLMKGYDLAVNIKNAISFLFGGVFMFVILSLLAALGCGIFVLKLAAFSPILLIYFTNLKYSFNKYDFVGIIPFIFLLFDTIQHKQAISNRFIFSEGDYFYYTAIVKSLSENLNLFSAVYHDQIPVGYQSFSFLIPGFVAKITSIPANTVLWGFVMPIYTIFSFGTLAYFIRNSVFKFIGTIKTGKYLFFFISSFFLILLAPINLLYLSKFDVRNFILLGEGYLLPTGSPCFALGIWIFAIALIFFEKIRQTTRLDYLFYFGFFISLISITKLAFFLPVFFYFIINYFISNLRDVGKSFFRTTFLFGAIIFFTTILYNIFITFSTSLKSQFVLDGGFFIQNIISLLTKKGVTPDFFKIAGVSVFLILSWFGYKIVLIAYTFIYSFDTYSKNNVISALFSIVLVFIPALFIRVVALDHKGDILQDVSFDNMQFVRSGFFLLSPLLGSTFLLSIFRIRNKFLIITSAFWFIGSALSFFLGMIGNIVTERETAWTQQVANEYKSVKPRLMVMDNSSNYSCQTLVANNVSPWWCFGYKMQGIDYVMSDKVNERVRLIKQILENPNNTAVMKDCFRLLNYYGVDYFISTPENIDKIRTLVNFNYLTPVPGSKWMFKVNYSN